MPTMTNPPRVNYLLPILATLGSTLIVIVLFAVLAFAAGSFSLRQLTEPTDDAMGSGLTGGLCGLLALILLGSILFFLEAILKGLRDLTQPMQRLAGWVDEKYIGRGGMGGHWVIVRLDGPPPTAPTAASVLGTAAAPAPTAPPAPVAPPARRGGRAVEAAPTTTPGFGAGLADVQQKTRRSAPAPAAAPVPEPPPRRDRANTRLFRLDKPVYTALRPGEPVTIGYSRFLEHVYYVEHQEGDTPVVLYNKALI
jgi:hypothetical protein